MKSNRLDALFLFALSAFLLAGAILTLDGCSSVQKATYTTVGATQVTVQTALGAWNVWVGQGKATVAQEQAVKAAFQKWQVAALAVCDLGKVTATPTTDAVYQAAIANAAQIQTDFINLLKSFGLTL